MYFIVERAVRSPPFLRPECHLKRLGFRAIAWVASVGGRFHCNDVRCWHETDNSFCTANVRFRGQNGHSDYGPKCLLVNQSGRKPIFRAAVNLHAAGLKVFSFEQIRRERYRKILILACPVAPPLCAHCPYT